MYYPEEIVEEVRAKNDIVDVISGYVRLQKKGSNYFGLCPFHNEKTSSFSVSPSRQMYHCFGCGAGGNVFTFLMNYENYSFPEAVKTLGERAGVALPQIELDEQARKKAGRRARLLEANKEAAKYYYYQLRLPKGQDGYQYLKRRELSDETIKAFGLGFSNKTSNDLYLYLKQKGFEDEILIAAGLVSHNERMGICDKFWNRVMFPIQDINHRVIGFGGRVMGDGEPKYLNSQETEIFDKSRNLYGLNLARSSRKGNLILCEGYMDVISMHQAGFTQAVASLGTAFTGGQANLLRRYTETVLLSYDSDGAGVKAALRAIGILKEAGLSAKVINLVPYKDPDEFIKAEGTEAFQKRIDEAENSFLYEIRMLERDYDLKDPEGKTGFHNEIARKLCGFTQDVERENYMEAVADKYHIGFENLRSLVTSQAARTGLVSEVRRPRSGIRSQNTAADAAKKSQRALLTWLADRPDVYRKAREYISVEDFTDELCRQIAGKLFEEMDNGQANPASIINMFEDAKVQSEAALVFHTQLEKLETKAEQEKALHDLILSVKRQSYEYYTQRMGVDAQALSQAIQGKKALEELKNVHIAL